MVAWCWWVSGACLLLAFISTTIGIVWSARPIRTSRHEEGVFEYDDGFKGVRGALALGVGLLFTTLAGLFALLAAPPWLA